MSPGRPALQSQGIFPALAGASSDRRLWCPAPWVPARVISFLSQLLHLLFLPHLFLPVCFAVLPCSCFGWNPLARAALQPSRCCLSPAVKTSRLSKIFFFLLGERFHFFFLVVFFARSEQPSSAEGPSMHRGRFGLCHAQSSRAPVP